MLRFSPMSVAGAAVSCPAKAGGSAADAIIPPMSMSNREVEIKLPFASATIAHGKLRALGAVLSRERFFEDNSVYDRPDGELRDSDRLLRVRRAGPDGWLTVKGPVPGEGRHKVRVELESAVADPDQVAGMLRLLGFEIAWRYQKYRTVYRVEDIEACVDETPIGCWVELEGDPEGIDRIAVALGFVPAQYVRATYRELAEEHAARTGDEVGDLLLDPPGGKDEPR